MNQFVPSEASELNTKAENAGKGLLDRKKHFKLFGSNHKGREKR